MKLNEVITDPFGRKLEGFWWSKQTPKYPKPVPGQLSQDEAEKIYKLIRKAERTAGRKLYRGFSTSRIDGSRLGSAEYTKEGWVWPDSLANHYVKQHRVKPSDAFLDFIGYQGKD